jgi:tetratricopeptide (TPR) repeat protein
LQKSLELFDDWGDKVARCQYAKWHSDEMVPDSIIKYIKPYHDSIKFIGHTAILAEAYIKKGNIDSAKIYVEQLGKYKGTNVVFYYNKSHLFALNGQYKEAYEWMKKAYNYNNEEWQFITNQRLGAINAEYDLLNAELQNEKRRARMMGVYNVILVVLVALLIVAMVLMKRYKRDINVMEIDIAKRKERFNVLFEKHKSDYKLDKGSVMTDAMRNLEKLHEAYPTLTRTEVAIIWLLFMKCSTDSICEMLNITTNYYYQRKSAIYRTFGIRGKDEGEAAIERIVGEYLFLDEE